MKHFVKQTLLVTSIALIAYPVVSTAKDPNVKAYCNNLAKTSTPGWTSIGSQHGVTIINKTNVALVYDVYFNNAIQYPKLREMPLDYSSPPYIPNAHQEHHFMIQPGQTFHYGEVTIEKLAGFPKRGRYQTLATTIIKINGITLDNCEHFTNIDIV